MLPKKNPDVDVRSDMFTFRLSPEVNAWLSQSTESANYWSKSSYLHDLLKAIMANEKEIKGIIGNETGDIIRKKSR